MKSKFILIGAIFCSIQMMAINITVQTRTGADLSNDIAIIGKWMFENQNLLLVGKDGSILATEPIDNIRKIVFVKYLPTDDKNLIESNICIYPNPTQDIVYVRGVDDTTLLRIYTLEGEVIISTTGEQINVQSLPNGTYLLQVGTQVVRFIKK